jgi:hypothetical protein
MFMRAIARCRGRRGRLGRDDVPDAEPTGEVEALMRAIIHGADASPRLTGGDVDADWQRAASSGEEAVGGSVATPDQDVVDELGEALGVGRPDDAEFWTCGEILRERDRHRWVLEMAGGDM